MDVSKLRLKDWLYENLDNYELDDSIFFKFKNIDKYRIRVPKFLLDNREFTILNKFIFIYDNENKIDIGGTNIFATHINFNADESEFIDIIEKCLIKNELLTKNIENIKEEILDYYINLDLIDPNIEIHIIYFFKHPIYENYTTCNKKKYMTSLNDEIIILVGIYTLGVTYDISQSVNKINNRVENNKNIIDLFETSSDNIIEIFLKIKQ